MPDLREQTIFIQALERDVGHRGAFLDEACASDPALRARVERLLHHHEHAASFLAAPVVGSREPRADADADAERPMREGPGTVIGPYKLLEQIGEGGMGVVFLAEQTRPVRRHVALKVIKAGMDTRQVVARFEAERQALAIMDHPHIAKVFDGGMTDSGRPYFVMELVKGEPITEYCDRNQLPTRQRLELFAEVCHAVQHAHQKGIIHRDLKPTNVLVSMHDTTAVVKVIDFGVAKALGEELTDKTLFTGFAQLLGTPLYMSPEQAGQSSLDVDTRSDIYSLGVLLYELLTGTTPFDKERFREAAQDEIRRIIREEEPPKPSTRLSESKATLASVSAQRHTEPAKLTKLVRGELDWIVMKSLEKDRARRYETANGLAADVRRYLAGETVQAVPPSAAYRLRKFARRNKAGLVMASVVAAALLLAVGSFGWVASDRAGRRVRTAAEVNQFLERAEALYADNKLPEAVAEVEKARGVLEASGSGADADLGRTVRQWLTDLDTADRLEEVWHLRTGAGHRQFAVFAKVFRDYGIDVEASPAGEAAARVAASRIKLDLALALSMWAGELKADPRTPDPAAWQRLVAISRAAETDPWRLRVLAAADAGDVQALRELADGVDPSRFRTRTLMDLGVALRNAGNVEAAAAFLRKIQRQHSGDFLINGALSVCLAELKPPPWDEVVAFRRAQVALRPKTAWAHNDLGAALWQQKKTDEALASYLKALELDPTLARAHYNVGVVLREQNRLPEAVAAYHKCLEVDPNYAPAHHNLGRLLYDQNKVDDALECFKNAVQANPTHFEARISLGRLLGTHVRDYAGSAAHYKKAIELDPKAPEGYSGLGYAAKMQGKLEEAVTWYARAIEADPGDAVHYYNLGAVLCDDLRRYGEAETCFRRAVALDARFADAHLNLGVALANQGKLDESETCLRRALELAPGEALAHSNLGSTLWAQGKLDEAVDEFRAAQRAAPGTFDTQLATVLHNRAMLLVTDLDPQNRDPGRAVKLATEAVTLAPESHEAWNTLGAAQYRTGNWTEAVAALNKSRKLRTDEAEGTNPFFLAMAHRQLGNKDEALQWHSRGVEWMEKNAPADEELTRLRTEAAALLGVGEKKQRDSSTAPTQPTPQAHPATRPS